MAPLELLAQILARLEDRWSEDQIWDWIDRLPSRLRELGMPAGGLRVHWGDQEALSLQVRPEELLLCLGPPSTWRGLALMLAPFHSTDAESPTGSLSVQLKELLDRHRPYLRSLARGLEEGDLRLRILQDDRILVAAGRGIRSNLGSGYGPTEIRLSRIARYIKEITAA